MPDDALRAAEDSFLVERSLGGDVRAFEILLHRYARLLRAYARRLTGSWADADDVVQDTFITAWNGLDGLADPAAVKSWLMKITGRKAIDRIRARRAESGLEDWDAPAPARDGPERRAEVDSQLEAVARILQELPDTQRQCWVLKEIGEYSYREIAEELDLPEPTVRGALARARTALLRGMEAWQ
ncbi:RNA polymerase sigma factor [Mycetocola spongiae]|uniref:RNA polymerase sigma factor n=1 Tax=Mycetocola spongiae TaxID=2859226 RepID=UPI001CF3BE4A|nr:RNA polymerase sigma factor [Mycetocola spongiae]UCR88120.1 RNA polymerase sigma factor [Mycetocola spongiae]